MTPQDTLAQSHPLSGMERIWFASLPLQTPYDPNQLPNDGLAALLTNPWKAVGAEAELPTDLPITMLFLYTDKGSGEFNETLIAQGITGTSFLTVREEEPLDAPVQTFAAKAALVAATASGDPLPETPPYYKNLEGSDIPIEVVTVGKLAYAHYHLSKDEAQIMAFRYAICRDPLYMVAFLNQKAREFGLSTKFTVVEDGSFRVVYQTDTDSPPQEMVASATDTGGGNGVPCVKVTGTQTDDDFTVDSMMFVRYRDTPTPTPDPTPAPTPPPTPAPKPAPTPEPTPTA